MKTFTLGNSDQQVLELIPDKRIKLVSVGSNQVCVSRIGKKFYAFQKLCPHRMASLNEGFVTNFEEVVCPLHQYRFDLNTGEVRAGSCESLLVYKAELTSSGLLIQLPQ
ncbi:Rieske (2Fe-2S) protein [Belliella kenyensis]|uniref:Rieske (2Fe-2S) protein n=1 Tax=Belliella kenyensis TaxID=1472724 RepID=A0ABV8EP90_9BACT|nr:Rieske 2Fe-2S domain-containing protein [Belliella kenyensis]MCH7401578.1 Rieske 2Fe-2S domain-containing protein [Belliella kenyensis]MDN3603142.1 Rieske 2Fe-2S domain-containing protein [Belliella kenyensis]